MTRWQDSIHMLNSAKGLKEHSIEDFFKVKNYQPQNEKEKHILEEFSLVASSLAILIHVANADRTINPSEKNQIINDIIFQIEQRPFEFAKLSEKFGSNEREIIENMYDKFLQDYQTNELNLKKIISDISLLYQNNPEKRYYLLRLCYYVALADNAFDKAEQAAIQKLAQEMLVPLEELKRIEKEVREEIAGK